MLGAFQILDVNRNGRLSSADIMHAMRELGEVLSEEEVEDMLALADVDKDGYVNFEDFANVILR
jgi:Ca2+-binding EF-hand superfamily protein